MAAAPKSAPPRRWRGRRASRPRRSCTRRARDRRAGGARHGDGRRQSLRPLPYGDFAVALLALGAEVVGRGADARRDRRRSKIPARAGEERRASCRACRSRCRPQGAFRFAKVDAQASARRLGAVDRRAAADGRRKHRTARASPMARWRRRPMRARAVEQALEGKRARRRDDRRCRDVAAEGTAPPPIPFASDWYRRERAAGASRPSAATAERSELDGARSRSTSPSTARSRPSSSKPARSCSTCCATSSASPAPRSAAGRAPAAPARC